MANLAKAALWLGRIVLALPAFIFTRIGLRDAVHAVDRATEVGIAVSSPIGTTILRVAFGGFPLGCGIIVILCLFSKRRLLSGLGFVATMLTVILAVRIYGMLADGSVRESMRLVVIESVLLVVTSAAIWFVARYKPNDTAR